MNAQPFDAAQAAIARAQILARSEMSLADVASRVARAVAETEPDTARREWTERFAKLIAGAEFLPSVPTLANAGCGGQLAACFVLAVDDSLESIYGTLHRAARIQQGSGGVGIEFSALRPRGTPIARSGGRTPGPVAFAELFARSAHVMSLAGRRAGAHLAILRDDHPDILEFVRAKRDAPDRFPQLGLAVGVSDALLRAARENAPWALRHPRGGSVRVEARALLLEIAESVLESGDPTLLFLDRIEEDNPTPSLGRLEATNPCGEQPLLPGESCVLGSLQLPSFTTPAGGFDEARLAGAVRVAIRFLDDAFEVNRWPDDEIARASRRTRKVGLGVMGLADVLLLRGLPYGSAGARSFVARVFELIAREADATTAALAEERGAFSAWEKGPRRRNATTRAFAPTGTLCLLAGCSAGIEPFLTPRLVVRSDDGERLWSDAWLTRWLEQRGVNAEPVLTALGRGVPHTQLEELAEPERSLLQRAWELPPEDQLAMQAISQHWVDGAVSKTVHLHPDLPPSPEELAEYVQRAREIGCKGVAFYRHSRATQSFGVDLRSACASLCDHREGT